jgi:hypothetical protein
MFQDNQVAVGHVQDPQPGNRFHIGRLVPMLCYINVPLCKRCGLRYFDPERAWMIHSKNDNDRQNWYDTGASFYEDIHRHKGGAHGRRIDIRPLMEHYQKGSWARSDLKAQAEWLQKHRRLWEPTPQMRGEKKVAVCAIGRNENRYAREWVEHYRKIGVSKVFIYDNYFGGETPLAETLADYVKTGFVEIIDIHDRQFAQIPAYEHCYRNHGNEYAWIGFFDFDELLHLKGKQKIQTVMKRYEAGDVVLVNWRIMTDNGLVHYDDRPMAKRFTTPMPIDKCVKYDRPENEHVKSIVRGGIDGLKFYVVHNPHCPTEPRLHCINPSGETVRQGAFAPIDHNVMWLDHYFTKTAEEWAEVKLSRGYHGLEKHTAGIIAHQEERFFAVNERTPEKEAIIKNVGNPITT